MEWSNEKEIVIGFSPTGNSNCDVIKNRYGPVGENLSLTEVFYVLSQIMYSILKTQNTLFDQTIMEDIIDAIQKLANKHLPSKEIENEKTNLGDP